MATVAAGQADRNHTGQSATKFVDRWIFVFMAVMLIAVTLTGFVPDSLNRIGQIGAGKRPPFPLAAHFHAIVTGSWLLLLLAQTTLVATGRKAAHRSLGAAAVALAPMVLLGGIVLSYANYRMQLDLSHAMPAAAAQKLMAAQAGTTALRIKHLTIFAVLVGLALHLRKSDSATHKRLMVLAPLSMMAAALTRITWLPTTMPASPLAPQVCVALLALPMFGWDLYRTGRIQRAYLIWMALYLPGSIAVQLLWDNAWWHSVVPKLMGVA